MRPEILFPLFKEISSLKGVGPRYADLIKKLAGGRLIDLVWHMPSHFIQRNVRDSVFDVLPDETATVELEIVSHQPPPNGPRGGGRANKNQPYKVIAAEDNTFVELIYFHARASYLLSQLPVGTKRLISGKVENRDGKRQILHPDYVVPPEAADTIPSVEAVYPLSAGLPAKTMRNTVLKALKFVPELDEWLDTALVEQHKWPNWHQAIAYLHEGYDANPKEDFTKTDLTKSRERLVFDELFADQLNRIVAREMTKRLPGYAYTRAETETERLLVGLPFEPTNDQMQAFEDIRNDLSAPLRMNRLLQGDVGSGKTLVALLAMAVVVANGKQCALMAPTDLLARQHMASINALLNRSEGQKDSKDSGEEIKVALLSGKMPAKQADLIRAQIETGKIDICIGTHALFQESVNFSDLGLIIVDEQHRFGVAQRQALASKGQQTEVLAMTATPIPRTLAMTQYGDMDVSRILEKPAGRKPINTAKMPISALGDVLARLSNAMQADHSLQAYWVCPLVEESERIDLAAAEERYTLLSTYFEQSLGKNAIALVHGKMTPEDKQEAMQSFASGDTRILVATTVIEVGVDVPNASIMIIEQAERFGLAQLHQLRGRVGRGSKSSSCLLIYKGPLSKNATAKLGVMLETEDGFRIAEEDLALRGIGEVLGTRQTGMPAYRLADLDQDASVLPPARKLAELTMNRAKNKPAAFPQPVKTLLYLFEKDQALKFRHV